MSKSMTIKAPKSTRRSGVAVAAMHRPPAIMRHRLQPRGGARNLQADIAEEYGDEIEERYAHLDVY
jgi:hypothetical protein